MSIFQQDSYEQRVAKRLSEAFDLAEDQALDLDGPPVVIVSDLHKGARNGADDFWRCERAYHTALGHYFEAGFRLFALGDLEELWEERPGKVIERYQDTLRLEARFHNAPWVNGLSRYERFWGNHDDHWKDEKEVRKHLHDLYPELVVREGLKLRVQSKGEEIGVLFLVHGHQGTSASDKYSGPARAVVRRVWRPIQRVTNISRNTPAKDYHLRKGHNRAMFQWASSRPGRLALIAGHTHKPVFADSSRSIDVLEKRLDEKRNSGTAREVVELSAKLELAKAEKRWPDAPPQPPSPPCYFNTGCCAFADGDVTALEIVDRKIRLVRWLDDQGKPKAQPLADAEDLGEIFDRIEAAKTGPQARGSAASGPAVPTRRETAPVGNPR